ncbi:MAG: GrlR family regulatory protein [Bacteroidota bacterium]
MISGIFAAVFASNQQIGGFGVAVFSDNAVHGGDASHYYRGKYKFDENNQILGTIEVFNYSNLQDSIFGPLKSFRLKLNGHVIENDKAFELSGQVEGQPGLTIKISLKKLDELVEA